MTNFSSSPEFIRASIQLALAYHKQIQIWYVDKQGNSEKRMVEPLEILPDGRFSAWCLLRNSFRHFSMNRVVRILVTDFDCTHVEETPKTTIAIQIGSQTVTFTSQI